MKTSLRLPISVCIPVRNEEQCLSLCIKSLAGAFADVVVIDSHSTDRTAEIASSLGARVLQFEWNGRFPKKRNWALRHVQFANDWILFLDADEHLTPAFITELEHVIPTTRHVGFWLSFTNHFMGHELRFGDRFRKIALFRRNSGEYEAFPEEYWSRLDMEVHEHPVLRGSLGEIRTPINHFDYRGLHHYIAKHNDYSTWEANRFRWLATAGTDAWNSLTSRQAFKYSNLDKWWLSYFYFFVCLLPKLGILDGLPGVRFAALKRRYFQDIRLKIIEITSGSAGSDQSAAP